MIYSKRHVRASALHYIDVQRLKQELAAALAFELKMPIAYFSDLDLEQLVEVNELLKELA